MKSHQPSRDGENAIQTILCMNWSDSKLTVISNVIDQYFVGLAEKVGGLLSRHPYARRNIHSYEDLRSYLRRTIIGAELLKANL
jgi:hypothetical protein